MSSVPWQQRSPDLVADVWIYPTPQAVRAMSRKSGWGCPCFTTKDTGQNGWDARLQLGDQHFEPGSKRRVGFVFLLAEGAAIMRAAGHFYFWESRFVGEAMVIS